MVAPGIWGWLADHTGRSREVVVAAASLSALFYLGVFATTSFWGLFLVQTLMSFFWSASMPLVEAATLSWLGKNTAHYGRLRSWGSIGFIVSVVGLGYAFDHIAIACLNRPLDVSFVLTDLLAKNANPGGPLSGLIDPELVAASGWSLGGFASMALAAGVDNIGYNMETELLPEEPPCPPESYVPIPADPRIKAILPLDGSNQCMQFYELARITVPAMGIGEEWSMMLDWGDPWTSWQARQHAAFEGHPSYRVDVTGAWHQSFSNICEAVLLLFDKGLIDTTRRGTYGWR